MSPHRRPRRALPALVLALTVLAGHAALLAWLGRAPGRDSLPVNATNATNATTAAPWQATLLPTPAAPVAGPVPTAAPLVLPAPTPSVPRRPGAEPALSTPTAADTLVAALAADIDEPPSIAADAAQPVALVEGSADLPVYPTRLPPPALLRYALQRGLLGGQAELVWAPAAASYTLSLEGRFFTMSVIGWASRGGFDGAGIAPQRFTDRRRGRDVRAANFQRDAGRISFSGPAVEYPLWPGSQDRLSWMLQLPAIVAAEPARFGPSASIEMFVVGARGDGDVWTFTVAGRENITLPAGPVSNALHLRRLPRKPYDTEVDVWLDPARHHLPVRLRLAVPQRDEATDFVLESLQLR